MLGLGGRPLFGKRPWIDSNSLVASESLKLQRHPEKNKKSQSMASSYQQREFAHQVVQQLRDAGHEALWAGGCVRDELLGKTPKDFDVATSARPEQVRELFGHQRTLAIGAAFGVISILGGKQLDPIEVATFRSDGAYIDGRHPTEVTYTTAEEDAQRRDFTINGLFYDPLAEKLIDYVGGEQDLQAGIVRAIGDASARFEEDKLRMLRAVRFATTFDFVIDQATQMAIQSMASQVDVVSAERIGTEFRKILQHSQRARGLQLLADSHLLSAISPELRNLASASESTWTATADRLARVDSDSLPVAMAALMISVGEGTSVRKLGRSLRYTNKEVERAAWLVDNIRKLEIAAEIPWPKLQRILVHEGSTDLMTLAEATFPADHEGLRHCRQQLGLPPEVLNPQPLVTGDDLVDRGLQPGKYFGELLTHVRDAQLEGDVSDQAQAFELVDRWLADRSRQ